MEEIRLLKTFNSPFHPDEIIGLEIRTNSKPFMAPEVNRPYSNLVFAFVGKKDQDRDFWRPLVLVYSEGFMIYESDMRWRLPDRAEVSIADRKSLSDILCERALLLNVDGDEARCRDLFEDYAKNPVWEEIRDEMTSSHVAVSVLED